MIEFISENASTVIISALVFVVIILDMIYLVCRKKQGNNRCSGCCANCRQCR